ncbi:MAG TPA: exodeoxyribonuclease VII small subunit [Chloroflexota bacterium]|nr:exodeoxyribonuclease VII small subunit [Chloroflexota bacterium]
MTDPGSPEANSIAPAASPPEALSFEQAYAELEKTVAALQQGQLSLDETLRLYERGTELARGCRQALDEVELKVSRLVAQASGALTVRPLQPTSPADAAPYAAEPSSDASRPAASAPLQPADAGKPVPGPAEPAPRHLPPGGAQRDLFD